MNIDERAVFDNYVKITAVATAAQFAAAEAEVGASVTPADVEPTTWAVIQRGRSISGMSHDAHVEQMRHDGREIAARLRGFDVFLTPTLPVPPRPLGWFDMSEPDIDVYNGKMRDDCAYTALFNVSGQPAMSLPLHWTAEDLPVGVQLVGRIGDERTLIVLAGEIEQARPWRHRLPKLSA